MVAKPAEGTVAWSLDVKALGSKVERNDVRERRPRLAYG